MPRAFRNTKETKMQSEADSKDLAEAAYKEAVKVADAVYATLNPYDHKVTDAYKFLEANAVKAALHARICNYSYEYHTLLAKYSKSLSDKDKLATAKANVESANAKAEEAAILADPFLCAFEPEKVEEIRRLVDANVKAAHEAFKAEKGLVNCFDE